MKTMPNRNLYKLVSDIVYSRRLKLKQHVNNNYCAKGIITIVIHAQYHLSKKNIIISIGITLLFTCVAAASAFDLISVAFDLSTYN